MLLKSFYNDMTWLRLFLKCFKQWIGISCSLFFPTFDVETTPLAHLILFPVPAEALSPNPTSHSIRRSSEGKKTCQIVEKSANTNPAMSKPPQIWVFSWLTTLIWCHFLPHVPPFSYPAAPPAGSLVEDIGEMILQLRRQVENLFSIKFGTLAFRGTARPSIRKWHHLLAHLQTKRQSTVKISSDDWMLM